jgi:hypothetical protein
VSSGSFTLGSSPCASDSLLAQKPCDQEPNLDIGRFWGGRYSGWLNWEELLRRQRVILLAEAASGKTEEFRHQCGLLQASGNPAFYLRIEDLADQGTEAALDGVSVKLLDTWLAGTGEGWFFLDSVDEAKLNRKSFDGALRRFAKDLGAGIERAHVYVSCRVTDWNGPDDRAIYSRHLPAWKRPVVVPTRNRTITAHFSIRSSRRRSRKPQKLTAPKTHLTSFWLFNSFR